MLMLIPALAIAAMVAARGVLVLRISNGGKVILCILVLAGAFKFQLVHWLGGPMYFAPELPGWVLLGAAWYFGVVLMLAILLPAADMLNLVWRMVGRIRHRRAAAYFAAGMRRTVILTGIAAVCSCWGIGNGLRSPEVKNVAVQLPRMTAAARPLRMAVLADLHAGPIIGREELREMVRRTNAAQPDVIVIAGDLVDGRLAEYGSELEVLKNLAAPLGVYGVPGNHEYYSGYHEWMNFLETLGIRMLVNEHVTLPGGIVLAGIADATARRLGGPPPDIAAALNGIPESAIRIMLCHQPRPAVEVSAARCDLQISGHTHGGMIPVLKNLVAGFNGGFVAGLYRIGAMQLYVTNGSGIWNGFPLRIFCTPEITLLEVSGR